MKAVIMAGGQGTRFWPWSTEEKPKQFLSLRSNKTLIQETYERFRMWLPNDKIYIVTTEDYLAMVKEQLPMIKNVQIIVEPARRDTAPCIALTALRFLKEKDDEVIVTAPSDQYIGDWHLLMEALQLAEDAARLNRNIVTLGIKPNRPETGYGYIETEDTALDQTARKVKQFIEKPSLQKAEWLLTKTNIFWNSGIFIWRPSTIAHYMKKYQLELWDLLNVPVSVLKKSYQQLPKVSVDYAILEKAESIYTIPVSFEWDDVGTWGSIERYHEKEDSDNIVIGSNISVQGNNCTVISDSKNTLVIGVDDIIVVCTDEGLLVCHKSQEQQIKTLIQQLKSGHFKKGGSIE